jgi:hypothetical protein
VLPVLEGPFESSTIAIPVQPSHPETTTNHDTAMANDPWLVRDRFGSTMPLSDGKYPESAGSNEDPSGQRTDQLRPAR